MPLDAITTIIIAKAIPSTLKALADLLDAVTGLLQEIRIGRQEAPLPKLPAPRRKGAPTRPTDPRSPSGAQRQLQARTKGRTTKKNVRAPRKVGIRR